MDKKKISIIKNFNQLFMKRVLIGIIIIGFFYYAFLFNFGIVYATFMLWYSIIIMLIVVYLQVYIDVKLHKQHLYYKNLESIVKRMKK